jgi:hypothetical protein
MRYFLDMSLIIHYCYRIGLDIEGKVIKFIDEKGENLFLVCYYIVDENLPRWIRRMRIIFKEIKKKINNPEYELWSSQESKLLFKKDKINGEKILKRCELTKNKKEFLEIMERGWIYAETRVRIFLRDLIDEKVISINEIDPELKSALFTFLNNMSDAMTLASGIQEHNRKELILITTDKEHWTKDNLEWALPEHSAIRRKYPKIPEIKYIQHS